MKLYPNRDEVALYVRSMGKMLKVTAIFDDVTEANSYMATTNDAIVACTGSLILLADQYDKGF